MREEPQKGPWGDSLHGGPWTRHGHPIPGLTVLFEIRPRNVARCGGVGMCRTCQADAEAARGITVTTTAAEFSPAEAAVVARFEAAPAAPESFDPIAALRRVEALAQELATVATYHHATVAGDAYADAAGRILAVLAGTYP